MRTSHRFRFLALSCGTLTLLGLILVGWVLSLVAQATAMEVVPGQCGSGSLTLVGDVPVLVAAGGPEERGRQQGLLAGAQAQRVLSLIRLQPKLLLHRRSQAFRASLAAIATDDRAEITALADAAGIPRDDLLAANAIVDAQCSALVLPASGTRPLLVGRNMDFFPARVLGPATHLVVVRGSGPRTYVSVGWPGAIGVISGMNDAGLTACILLNHAAAPATGGEPLALRVRRILAEESTVDGALCRYAASPVGMGHFVLLADAQGAAITWTGTDGIHVDRLGPGWLSASNGGRGDGQADDARGRRLCAIAAQGAAAGDAAWLRRAISASYLRGINAQAMVFIPAQRHLQLARGTGTHPAALAEYRALDLGPVLDGGDPAALSVASLPAVEPMRHYNADEPDPSTGE